MCVKSSRIPTPMHVFRISFLNQGKIYEIYAKRVQQGELYGFVEVQGLLFEDSSKLLVDPSTERLKAEFKGYGSGNPPADRPRHWVLPDGSETGPMGRSRCWQRDLKDLSGD